MTAAVNAGAIAGAIDGAGRLPVDGRIPPADVLPVIASRTASETGSALLASAGGRRVLRGLVHRNALRDALVRAGVAAGTDVLLWRCGPAAELPALLLAGVGRIVAVDSATTVATTARRWGAATRSRVDFETWRAGMHYSGTAPAAAIVPGAPTEDEVHGIRALLEPDGILVVVARPPCPDTTYAWDRSLQARVDEVLAEAPEPSPDVAAGAALALLDAIGPWDSLTVSSYTVEHVGLDAPELLREQLTQDFALRHGSALLTALDPEDRAQLSRLHDPDSGAYLFARDDLHLLQTGCLVTGRLPGV